MVEERNERDGFVSPSRAVEIVFKSVGVVVNWVSKGRIRVSQVFLKGFWKEVATLFGQNTEKLFEWFERLPQIKLIEFVSSLSQVVEIKRHIAQQRRIVVGIVPRPAAKVQEVVFVHELEPVQVKSQDRVELLHLL